MCSTTVKRQLHSISVEREATAKTSHSPVRAAFHR